MPDSAQRNAQGKARDIVAKNVGLRSGHEVDRAIKKHKTSYYNSVFLEEKIQQSSIWQ